jgi:hypothetical protein
MITFSDGSMHVHGIKNANDGEYSVGRQYVGTAADPYTAMALVELLELRGYKYVHLSDATYGSLNCFCPRGAFSLDAVKAELYIAMDRAKKEELEAEAHDISLEDLEFEDRMREDRMQYEEAEAEAELEARRKKLELETFGLTDEALAERRAEWAEAEREADEEEMDRY